MDQGRSIMYFSKAYNHDLRLYKQQAKNECTCGRIITEILKDESIPLHDFKKFCIYTFFLNLYHEVIQEEFSDLLGEWNENMPEHIGYKCDYNDNILSWHRFLNRKRYKGELMRIRGKDYVDEYREFKEYINKTFRISIETIKKIEEYIATSDNYDQAIKELINYPYE